MTQEDERKTPSTQLSLPTQHKDKHCVGKYIHTQIYFLILPQFYNLKNYVLKKILKIKMLGA